MPHFGQGAFLGAQRIGITIGVGASVPMVCISGGEDLSTLIHRDAGPNFQEQNDLVPSLGWWRSARSLLLLPLFATIRSLMPSPLRSASWTAPGASRPSER